MKHTLALLTGLLLLVAGTLTGHAVTPAIYWADILTNKIQRSALDGSGVTDLVTGLGNPTYLTVVVPEPARALLSLLGLGAVLVRRRR